jgi:hypothetical protein
MTRSSLLLIVLSSRTSSEKESKLIIGALVPSRPVLAESGVECLVGSLESTVGVGFMFLF